MKRQPKFKVGDKVKVLRVSTDAEYALWRDSWQPEMSEVVGRIAIIKHVTYSHPECEYHKYMLSITHYYFPEFVLQKVNEVGRQLLFSFMGE